MPTPLTPITAGSNFDISGSTWSTSSNLQTSGTPVEYAEYKQWLTIDYHRNPIAASRSSQNPVWNLNYASGVDYYSINYHGLHFNITTHNSCNFVTGNFGTSSYHQSQKLVLNSEVADKVGTTYGDVSGVNNAYVFGPQGSIATTQPHIRRNIKTSNDVQYSVTQQGTTNALEINFNNPWTVSGYGNGADLGIEYRSYLTDYHDINRNRWDKEYCRRVIWGAELYFIQGGGYATSSEVGFGNNAQGLAYLISFIETNCDLLANSNYRYRYCVPLPTSSDGAYDVVESDRLPVNPYYSTSVHDYT
tara:strand:+ start:142 stop:1053 length:912 start_codon:yes stop_codon:yes gene_type:complete